MGMKLLAQFVLIAAALVIVFAFIQPTLADIKNVQDELFQYKEAVTKAEEINVRLRELTSARDSLDSSDMLILERFVPTEIDAVNVMKEIEHIFGNSGVTIFSLTAQDEVLPISNVAFEGGQARVQQQATTNYRDFEIVFSGSYEQLKQVLGRLESNAVLLEVMNLQFDTSQSRVAEDGGERGQSVSRGQNFIMTLRAFGLADSQQ
jgi:hypothetical protein